MNALFFGSLILLFAASALQMIGSIFKKEKLSKIAWIVFLTAFAALSVFIVIRGISAKRVPLANQFEFATAFAWGIRSFLLHTVRVPTS